MAQSDDGGTERNPWAFGHTALMPDGSLYTTRGMTLRDWLAGRAMAGLMSDLGAHLAQDGDAERVELALKHTAKLSFMVADAMLKERRRG